MAMWKCVQCDADFKRDAAGNRVRRFCGNSCYHAWQKSNPNKGQFSRGRATWNKGMDGLRVSPATEFKKGQRGITYMPIGAERKRLDKITKTPRIWVKVADGPRGWKLRAVLVWERQNGPVSAGKVIHHCDHNSLNDAIENLSALTRAEHIAAHREANEASRLDGLRKRRIHADAPLFAEIAA